MLKLLNQNKEDIYDVIQLAAGKLNLEPIIVEKDLWVCYILDYLFNRSMIKMFLQFKGGTSLSKGFNLINRFSEDIDIIINPQIINRSLEQIMYESKTKRDKLVKNLNHEIFDFYKTTFLPQMKKDIDKELVHKLNFELSEKDASIYIDYPSSITDNYISSTIKLEIGPIAAWESHQMVSIKPYIAQIYPKLFHEADFNVLITNPTRTFYEKIMILHKESHRDKEPYPLRYSRHYYDVYKIYNKYFSNQNHFDVSLLEAVKQFHLTFYYAAWPQYETAIPGMFKLVPDNRYLKHLYSDFKDMKHMIFKSDQDLSFDDILITIKEIEEKLNIKV